MLEIQVEKMRLIRRSVTCRCTDKQVHGRILNENDRKIRKGRVKLWFYKRE